MSFLIRGGLVVTMNAGRQMFEGGFVHVADDGSIAAVGAADQMPSAPHAAVIDATGMVVLPGLIDACHVHSQNLLMGARPTSHPAAPWTQRAFAASHFDASLLADAARVSAHALLRGGTTCALNLMPSARGDVVKATVDAMRGAGLRQIQALPFTADSAPLAQQQLQQQRAPGHGWARDGMTHLALEVSASAWAGHRGQASEAVTAAAYRLARDEGSIVVSRTTSAEGATAPDWQKAVRSRGRSDALHLMELGLLDDRWVLIGAEALRPADLSLIVESGCSMVCTPMASAQRGHSPGPWPELLRAGTRCALGSDASARAPMTDMLELMKSCMLTNNASRLDATSVSSESVLEMATIHAAKALGIDALVGSLEPGKRADIAVFDLRGIHTQVAHKPISLLVTSAGAHDAAWVLVDGRVIVRNGLLNDEARADDALENCMRQARVFGPLWDAALADAMPSALEMH